MARRPECAAAQEVQGISTEDGSTGAAGQGHASLPPPSGAGRAAPGKDSTFDSFISSGGKVSAYSALLRNRNYRLWFTTALFAGLADWTGLFALQVVVTTMTDSGSRLALFALGGIMMARLLPSLVLGPVAGVLADRYDRKRLMVFTNVARGSLYFFIAFSDNLVTLFTLVFVVESMSLLFLAAKDATLPLLVRRDHLTQANQMNLLVTYGTLPLGALVGSAMIPVASLVNRSGLIGVSPPLLALLVTAVSFLCAAGLLSRLLLPARARRTQGDGEDTSILTELREGLRFIRDLPLVRSLILGVIGVFFSAGVVITLGPAFVQTSLGASGSDWFTLMALVGAGLVLGLVVVPLVLRVARKEAVFPVSLSVAAVLVTAVALLDSFRVTLLFGLLLGASVGLTFVIGYTLLQEYTDDDVRARTFAAFYTGTRIAMFTALGLAPFIAGAVGRGTIILGNWSFTMSGIRLTMVAAGLFALFCALTSGRGIRAALRTEPDRHVHLPSHPPPPHTPGVFVAFEGVEGSGKSTQIARLADALRSEGYGVVVTREPGGPEVSERIRTVLLDPAYGHMDPRTEALLLAASRAEHVQQVILPSLERGSVVLCDRYLDSSLAYQGHARGLGIEDVFEINRWAIGGLLPDVVILLNMDPAEGLRRAGDRADSAGAAEDATVETGQQGSNAAAPRGDRMEREGIEFHTLVAEGFLRLAKKERHRFRIVDARGEVDAVARQVRSALLTWLPMPKPSSADAGQDGARPQDRAGVSPDDDDHAPTRPIGGSK